MPKKRNGSTAERVFAKTRRASVKSEDPKPIYVFRVELVGEPEIWRRIEILMKHTLESLHFAIFDAFDRDDEHLYAFYLQPPGSRRRNPRTDADTFIHPAAFDPYEERTWSSDAVTLAELQLKPGRKLHYEFDFGDSWWHVVTLERSVAKQPRVKYPSVVERHGESPPQYPDLEDENWDEDE